MTQIIGLAGKMGSGKSTQMRFIHGFLMKHFVPHPSNSSKTLIDQYHLNSKGELLVDANFEDGSGTGPFDVRSRDPEMIRFLQAYVWPYVKGIAMADTIKDLGMTLFNIPEECLYGTQEQKLKKIEHLRWENMPGVITREVFEQGSGNSLCDWFPKDSEYGNNHMQEMLNRINLYFHDSGPMSGREFLQYMGTEVFRRIMPDFHVNGVKRTIDLFNPLYAIIDDIRFPNELKFVKDHGIVIYLDRIDDEYNHKSENSITKEDCDFSIDTRNMSIGESCMAVLKILQDEQILPEVL